MKRSSPSTAESLMRSCWQERVKRMPVCRRKNIYLRFPFSNLYHIFLPVLVLLLVPMMVRAGVGDEKTKASISSGSVDNGNKTPSIIDVRGSLTDRSSSLTNSQKNNSYENVFAVSATIVGTATVCVNAVTYITFTGSNGVEPYTFIYTLNGAVQPNAVTVSGPSTTISVPTSSAGSFVYQLLAITDSSVPFPQGGGPSGSSTATVTVNALPTVNPITGPVAVCIGSTISLTSTTSGGAWSSNNAAATIDATGLVTGVSAGSPIMSYGVTSLGCTTTVTTTTTVNPNPVINTIAPLSPSVCRGQTSFVENFGTSNSPDQYQILWDATAIAQGFTNVSFTPNNFNPAVGDITVAVPATAAAPASYAGILTLKISATGCQFTGLTATVDVNPLPTVVVANPAAVCTPATVDLTAASITSVGSTAGLSYTQWTDILATSALINANAVTTTGTYYIKGTVPATGCAVTQPVTTTINTSPTVTISNPAAVCSPLTIDLTAASITTGSTGGLTYTRWTDALATSALANANAVTTTGTYYIKGTVVATGCAVTQPVSVTINSSPTVTITNPVAVCSPSTIDLTSSIITAGSTGGLTYTQWTDVLATSALVNANAVTTTGTYYIKGTVPATGCAVTQPVTTTINTSPTVTITNPGAVCSPLTIDLTAASITAGSTAGLTYTRWTDALATSALSNANTVTVSGTYYIKGTVVATGCAATQPVSATINALPTVTITNPAAVCTPATVDLTSTSITTGSTAGLTYTRWTDALATSALSNANAVTVSGTYYIKGTVVATGCAATQPVSATINALPTVTITNPAAVCTPATVDLTSTSITTGSTAGLTYTQWRDALTTSALANANAVTTTGTYYIKGLVPATGCSVTQPVSATINSLPTVIITNPAAVCSPSTIDLTVASITTGSTAGLIYTQWIDALTTSTLTNANAVTSTGTYYIKGTVVTTGCAATQPVTATINSLPTVTITNPVTVCSPSTIDLTVVGITAGSSTGLIYTRWTDALATSALANANAVTATGTYYIKGLIPATGCAVTQPVSATINTSPNVIITNPAAVCAPSTIDLTSAGITTGSTAGLTYSQWKDAITTSALANANAVIATGTYYIKGTIPATGCSATQSVSAIINTPPTVAITNPAAVCSPSTIDLTVPGITTGSTPGLTYTQWTDALAASVLTNANAVTTTGTYYIKGTVLATGCSATQPVSATINTSPTVIITNPAAVCSPSTIDLTATNITTGSTAGLTYTRWADASAINALSNATAVAVSGTYYIKGTTAANCSVIQPVVTTINPLPTVTITNPTAVCSPATVDLTSANITTGSTGGLTYTRWTNAVGTNPLLNDFAVAASGTYYIKGTTVANCSVIQPVVTTVNLLPTVTINAVGPTTFCSGASVNLTASAGSSYLWNTNETSQTINVTATGNKSVTVTDVNGCSATSSVTAVTVNALPTATITANGLTTFCAGGTVNLTAGGGLSYLWNSGETSQTIQVTGTANKQVTVTDANGCSANSSITAITVKPLPLATISTSGSTTFCEGGAVILTAAAGNNYVWNSGETTQSVLVTNSAVKQVTVTGANGCSATSTAATVTVNPAPNLVVAGISPVCSPSSINLTSPAVLSGSTAGLTITHWRDAAATLPLSNPASVNSSGTYYIKGTTSAGCSVLKAVNLSVHPQPTLVVTDPAPVCSPSTISLLDVQITTGSSSGTSFSYWNDAAATQPVTTPSAISVPGTYFIKGSLQTGCTSIQPVTVNIFTPPVININNPAPVCEPSVVNLITTVTTGGNAADVTFMYYTDAAQTNQVAMPSAVTSSGTYYIKGISKTGCSALLPVAVVVNPLPKGVLQNPSVNYICDGSTLVLNAVNAATYQWYADQKLIPGATASSYTAAKSGNYTVQFISKEGCTANAANTIRLDLLTKPVLQFKPNSLCAGSPVSFTNNSVVSNSGGITWQWDFGDGSSSNTQSPVHTFQNGGSYAISLTANNASCSNLTEKIIANYIIETTPAAIRYDTIKAVGGKFFIMDARAIGVNYLWHPAAGLNNPGIRSPGVTLNNDMAYTVTIKTAAGCVTNDSVYVKVATEGDMYVAQGFTPNGDGLNDRCYPMLVGIRTLTYFKVFNRWGNLVFQTNDATPQNGWDGKLNGKLQTTGTYIWAAEAIDGGGNIVKRTGNILLIN